MNVSSGERVDLIVERLQRSGFVTSKELIDTLGASGPTIRRDLARLERDGVLQRVHGGAVLITDGAAHIPEPVFSELAATHAIDKDAIAEMAVGMVRDGETVLLDIGTTTARIARLLRGRDVRVITSNLAAFDELRTDDHVDLVLLGGSIRRHFETLVGPLTEDAIRSVSADIAFLSCTGVRSDGAIVDDIVHEATVKRAIIGASTRVVLVATASKFPGSGSIRIGSVDQVNDIVTTAELDQPPLASFQTTGGAIHLVEPRQPRVRSLSAAGAD
jgi:DeoR/GlpR family transcriptional regulator of sugar metabolism